MGMVIIPMSIMHISIPKRIAIMSVRLLPVPGVPVRFVVHRVALKTYHVNRLNLFLENAPKFCAATNVHFVKMERENRKMPPKGLPFGAVTMRYGMENRC